MGLQVIVDQCERKRAVLVAFGLCGCKGQFLCTIQSMPTKNQGKLGNTRGIRFIEPGSSY